MNFEYRPASLSDLEMVWDKNIADNPGDERWVRWKEQSINDNLAGKCKTFVFVCDGKPMGEGTLLFSPECEAIAGRTVLADGKTTANINALRNDPMFENQGHISKLINVMEKYAADNGIYTLTIGVEEKELRNRAIYGHWKYTYLVLSQVEDGEMVLYYAKQLNNGIIIRPSISADAYDFAYVLCESWKAAYKDIITPEEMEKNTDIEKRTALFKKIIPSGKGQFYIAYDNCNPCGICSTCPSRDKDMQGYGEVVAIYTLPEYWGKGIGKQLMNTAFAGLKAQGFTKVMLWTFKENTRARRFYEKCGFTFDGTNKESGFAEAKEVRYRLEQII